VKTFNPGASQYRGLSVRQIRNSVTRKVWKPARKRIGDWVEARVEAYRSKPVPVPQAREPKTPTFDGMEIANQIRKFEGNGIVVIGDTYFAAVAKALHDSCVQNP
jgi:hypothetical protein